MEAGKKRGGLEGPTPPKKPIPKRSNSVGDISSVINLAAGLVPEHSAPPPQRSSTPVELSDLRDPRAPATPLSPVLEASVSLEHFSFEEEPLAPQPSVVLRPPVLQFQPQAQPAAQPPVEDMAVDAEAVPPAETKVRLDIQNALEEAEVWISGARHAGSQRDEDARQAQRFRKASQELSLAETSLNNLKGTAVSRIAKIQHLGVREASRIEWVGYKIDTVDQIETLREKLIQADPSRHTEEQQRLVCMCNPELAAGLAAQA